MPYCSDQTEARLTRQQSGAGVAGIKLIPVLVGSPADWKGQLRDEEGDNVSGRNARPARLRTASAKLGRQG